jgi:hypothetical protein
MSSVLCYRKWLSTSGRKHAELHVLREPQTQLRPRFAVICGVEGRGLRQTRSNVVSRGVVTRRAKKLIRLGGG